MDSQEIKNGFPKQAKWMRNYKMDTLLQNGFVAYSPYAHGAWLKLHVSYSCSHLGPLKF